LYPAEGVCGLGSLTLTGVEQQIISGAFLCKAKHKLFVSDDDNFSNQVLVCGTVSSSARLTMWHMWQMPQASGGPPEVEKIFSARQ